MAHKRPKEKTKDIARACFSISLLAAALAVTQGGVTGWIEWVLTAWLWFLPGLFLLIFLPMLIAHFVFGKWPADVTRPDGETISVPPADWTRPARRPAHWIGRITLLGVAGLFFYADRPALAAAYVCLLAAGPVFLDGIVVAQAGWNSRVLPLRDRVRYVVMGVTFHLVWGTVRLAWFLFKLPFRLIAAAWHYGARLYGASEVFRYLAIGFGVILLLPLLPFYLLWQLYCGIRDGRALRTAFGRTDGLIYFLYSEPHQFEHFLGAAGLLAPVRSAVVARDWRLDLGRDRQRSSWPKSAEGRMLNHLMVRSLRTDLPLVVVARPWRPARVHLLSAPYRARMRDAGRALAEAESSLANTVRWARKID